WRTIMLPGTTNSPPYFFTPRRFECESRPLRDDPPAFLCAISVTSWSGRLPSGADDVGNPNFRQILAVAPLAPGVLATALLERDELRAAGLLHELRRDLGSRDGRRSDLRRPVASDHQYFRELHLGPRLTLDLLDDENVV